MSSHSVTCMDPDGIPLKEEDYLYTGLSGLPDAGQGLYTAIPLYKDEVIAIFHGERLSATEAGDRAAQGLDRYFMELPDRTTLDAMGVKGFAKFANDAKVSAGTALRNNAVITLDDSDRVCLRATRRIRVGEEILCGYGKRYWKRHGE
ncbi:MAG: SET domain-containing protein [Flavobacteriales bacterium]